MRRPSGEFACIHMRSATAAGGSFEIQRDNLAGVVVEPSVAAVPEAEAVIEGEPGYTVEEAIEHMGFGR